MQCIAYAYDSTSMGLFPCCTTEQPRFGPCIFQNDSGKVGSYFLYNSESLGKGDHVSYGGNDTPCGCAEQYGRDPGLAKYC